ncbi:DJ-1/PfpI family protein [Micromonospora sp. WMMD882]|uniref:DJ-1/PfpI family protein n=1 Tax=Micromonospora sp. WMMD882 TaxID=3015151 RepID=UPI00248B142C|nr:DJ-1/PfpI family protein [Micromonospora sp. WMMD882]WBB77300.1 DJ-1/PfpI family protein [Micromonospora sp. WMMD882]
MDRRDALRATVAAGAVASGAVLMSGSASAAPRFTPARPLRVQIVTFDGVEELDFVAPIDVFGLAKGIGGGTVSTSMVTVDGDDPVAAFHGSRIGPVGRWAPREADVLLVPGGGYRRADAPGVLYEIQRGVVPAAIAAARRRGLTIAGVCTGTMLLSAAGLTAGRPCITHHRAVEDLRAQGGLVTQARVVDDGDLVTAGGVTSGLDLALWLVERFLGVDLALQVEQVLEYERRGAVWRR